MIELSPATAEIMARWEAEERRKEEESRRPPPPAPTVRRIGPWWVGKNFSIHMHADGQTITNWQTGRRMICGVACTPVINGNKRSLNISGCRIQFPVPLLCAHHDLGQIGDVVSLTTEPRKLTIKAVVWDTAAGKYAWELIRSGEMRGLSIGSTSIRRTVVDGVSFFEAWLLREVSICRVPANPDCTLEIMRDD
jgi:HK97 family phage prohead protease